jgi:hypothetical protein
MEENESAIRSKSVVLRVAVWGLATAFLWMSLSLGLEDWPTFFSRVGAGHFVWPIVAVLGMHLLRLDRVLARRSPKGFLAFMVLLPSVAGVVGAYYAAALVFGIPTSRITPDVQFARTTSVATLALFALVLVVVGVMVARMFRGKT